MNALMVDVDGVFPDDISLPDAAARLVSLVDSLDALLSVTTDPVSVLVEPMGGRSFSLAEDDGVPCVRAGSLLIPIEDGKLFEAVATAFLTESWVALTEKIGVSTQVPELDSTGIAHVVVRTAEAGVVRLDFDSRRTTVTSTPLSNVSGFPPPYVSDPHKRCAVLDAVCDPGLTTQFYRLARAAWEQALEAME